MLHEVDNVSSKDESGLVFMIDSNLPPQFYAIPEEERGLTRIGDPSDPSLTIE